MERRGLTEETVVSKVGELLEALDNTKRYRAFARSLRGFAAILATTISLYVILRIALINFILPELTTRILLSQLLLLLIPIAGLVAGILYVNHKVNAVKTGQWKGELAQGFPSALQKLQELNWQETFDEISEGKLGYMIYSILKTVGYWIVIFFVLLLGVDIIRFISPVSIQLFSGALAAILATLITYIIVGNDLQRRYREVHSLDMLLWELRGLSLEFRRDEFKA
jgi:hypothetical protein